MLLTLQYYYPCACFCCCCCLWCLWCWPAPVVVTGVAVVFAFVVRQFRVGGGAGRETAAVRRIGRTGPDQQRADVCPGTGVESANSRRNTTFIGVAVPTQRGFNEQHGGGAGPRAAAGDSHPGVSSSSGLTHVRGNAGTKHENATNFVYRRAGRTQKEVNERLGGGVGRPTAK